MESIYSKAWIRCKCEFNLAWNNSGFTCRTTRNIEYIETGVHVSGGKERLTIGRKINRYRIGNCA